MLPYTADILFSVHGRFLADWGWISVFLGALALIGAALSQTGRDARAWDRGGRLLALAFAAGWAWVGVGFFLGPMAAIDFSAPIHGGAFLLQAGLLLWVGSVRGRLAMRIDRRPRALIGAMAILLAALVYPLIDGLLQTDWAGLRPIFAAPGATALATLGLVLTVRGRPPLLLCIIPVLWCALATARGWALGIPGDLVLLPFALVALALAIGARRSC